MNRTWRIFHVSQVNHLETLGFDKFDEFHMSFVLVGNRLEDFWSEFVVAKFFLKKRERER